MKNSFSFITNKEDITAQFDISIHSLSFLYCQKEKKIKIINLQNHYKNGLILQFKGCKMPKKDGAYPQQLLFNDKDERLVVIWV